MAMARKARWGTRVISAAVALVAAGCFTVRILPWFNGERAALATADLFLPKAAQEAYRQELTVKEGVIEPDGSGNLAQTQPEASPTPSATPKPTPTPTPKPTPVPTPKPGAKAYPITETQMGGGTQVGNLFIRNSTKQNLDFKKELQTLPDLKIKADGTPMVLIYHTHTTESYLPSESPWFYEGTETRSQDGNQSVVMVGNAIEAQLKAAGFGVIHDTTIHDYPAYTGGYTRSAETMKKNLKKYPSIQITLDIHRDAIGGNDGERIKPTATVNGKKAAQFMILTGCDDDGTLGFPNWRKNLGLALQLQQTASDLYPGLARPLNFCNRVYNENLTTGSLLVECGTEVNTVEEAAYTGRLFGEVLVKTLQKIMESQG